MAFNFRLCSLLAAAMLLAAPAAAAPQLHCQLEWLPLKKGGAARPLRLTLTNRSPVALQVLEWATPFEGWLWPFVQLQRDGQTMPYQGGAARRVEPVLQEYLRIEPGQQRQATVDLADAFDLTRPGRYELAPRLQLRDVVAAPDAAPRTRSAFQPLALDCPALAFSVAPR